MTRRQWLLWTLILAGAVLVVVVTVAAYGGKQENAHVATSAEQGAGLTWCPDCDGT